MGLFSPRKSEDNPENHATSTGGNENAVIRVIRSRLYGKNKGKGRESPSASYISTDAPVSQTLSGPNAHPYSPTLSSPLARSKNLKQSMATAGPSNSPRIPGDIEPATPPPRNAKRPHPGSPDMLPPPPPKSPAPANRQREREKEKEGEASGTPTKSPPAPSPRKATDTVTVTLAQKLNELAMANSEGLLNDDEYRLLRQNLFERFATTVTVPTESPVVPLAKPRSRSNDSPSASGRSVSRPLSNNFQVELHRSPSRGSLSSGVASLFRRATGRRSTSGSKDLSDGSSFMSEKSATSSIPRTLARRSSVSSVNTSASHAPTDSISITSRKMIIGSDRAHMESVTSFTPTTPTGTRSTGSVRRFNTPPSSFRAAGLDNKQLGSYSGLYDDDRLQTSQDIKQEILTVEAEAKNMMDAFNGLELTTLTKLQKVTGRNSVIGPDGPASTWTLVPDGQSNRMNVDNDGSSIMSGTSGRTSASIARSAYSAKKARPKKSLGSPISVGHAAFLHRQNSTSSVNLPSLGNSGLNVVSNNSSISLTKSINHSPMRVVPEGGEDRAMAIDGDEEEMEEIWRRREEVMMRYEARLEYLRARLKGAQLHEKLLKK